MVVKLGGLVGALRSAGALDGLWTAATSAGSKAAVLALLAAAADGGGTRGLAGAVLALATGGLALGIVDAGLTVQSSRVFAMAPETDRRILRKPLAIRAAVYALVVPGVGGILFSTAVDNPIPWAIGTALYGLGFQLSQVTTVARYGAGAFRNGAMLNGGIRLISVPLMLTLGASNLDSAVLIYTLATVELTIAAAQYANLPHRTGTRPLADPRLRVATTWKFGASGALNGLINRSDSVLISGIATAATLATYGVASQLENALTTVALIPSGAILVYAARGVGKESESSSIRGVLVIATTVAAMYLIIGAPAIIWVEPIVEGIFGATVGDTTPLVICVIAGFFSVLGGVATQYMVGIGASSRTLGIWIVVAVVAVIALPVGASLGGATGAALGALARDVVFCGLGWLSISRVGRRRHGDA